MEYRVIRSKSKSDYIEHALSLNSNGKPLYSSGRGRQKGAQNKNHKYLARAWWRNKWQYAYTEAEVRALQMLGKAKETASDVKNKVQTTAKKASDVATGKYARAVDSKADQYAESAAKKAAASQRQASEASSKRTQASTAKAAAQYDTQNAGKLGNVITGKSKMYKEAANTNTEAAKKANTEASRLSSLSTQNAIGARSDSVKAKAAEAEKETAAYKVSKASSKAQNAIANTSNKVSNAVKSTVDDAKQKIAEKKEERSRHHVVNPIDTAKEEIETAKNAFKSTAAGRYATNATEAKRAEKDRDAATEAGNRQAAIEAENRRENAETQKRNAANDIKKSVSNIAESVKDAPRAAAETAVNASEEVGKAAKKGKAKAEEILKKASDTAKSLPSKVSNATEKAKDVATGKYAKDVDRDVAKAKETEERAREAFDKEYLKTWQATDRALKTAFDNSPEGNRKFENAINAGARASANMERYSKLAQESEVKQFKGKLDQQTNAYKVSKAVNDTKDKVSETADKASDAVKSAVDKGKSKVEELFGKASTAAKSAASKAYDKVTDDIEKVRESDAMAYVNKATDKVSNTAERIADKASDIKANAEHKAYANEMKRKYGADSLHYKDAQAYVEHDKAVDELRKARDKYGVGSAEYKSASMKERSAREKMDDVHEQNLYANNQTYKKLSDQANSLGRYIDNMDARGGPQTAEGKANYRQAVQDLQRLEAQLERLWNEDWE